MKNLERLFAEKLLKIKAILNGYYDKMKSDHYYDLSFTKNNELSTMHTNTIKVW